MLSRQLYLCNCARKGWGGIRKRRRQISLVKPQKDRYICLLSRSCLSLSAWTRHSLQPAGGTKGAMWVKEIEVKVIDNDIEKAMRILKKKIQNDGLFKRLKLKKSYEKPSEHRRRKQREAQRRERIAAARAARRR